MAVKQVEYEAEARRALATGIETLANAVGVTLGPKGRNVLLDKSFGSPIVSNDGVTIAKEIDLEDPFENLGVQMVKEVAKKTNDDTGDGTTTATILANRMVHEGIRAVTSGANPMALKRGMDKAAQAVIDAVVKTSKHIRSREGITGVAMIAGNNDPKIGEIIADAIEQVGQTGVITVEEGKTFDMTVDVVEGMQFDRGYLSPHFISDFDRMETVLEDCLILVHEKKISVVSELLPLLQKVATSGRGLLIIAEDVESEALATLVVNKLRGILRVVAVKAPAFGDRRKAILQDIAILTGASYISEDLGLSLENVTLDMLGSAKRVVVKKDNTTIVEGAGKKKDVKARCELLKKQIKTTTSDYDREKLEERLAKLASGVAVLRIGAATESEMKERKARVEDALAATRAAVEEGVVVGGGVALLRAADKVAGKLGLDGDESVGADVVLKACAEPAQRIAKNAGVSGEVAVQKIRDGKGNFGFNAQTETYEDLYKSGIIDPTKVVRTALQNAVSVASLVVTTEALIVEKPEKDLNEED
ncbi:MAG: chaperonin GroEL [Candidatus Hydrogenedentes bacterium]|nr:chaperonin GroEL [Candidatus Hydrogenedentota bacterium]